MYVPFNSLSSQARLWIYQSDRKFTTEDRAIIHNHLELFTKRWAAHGQPLQSSFDIRFDQFVLLAVDESSHGASGCSIDDSVRALKELEAISSIDFFNRSLIAFFINEKVTTIPQTALRPTFDKGAWDENTPTFNNTITEKSKVDTEWLLPAGKTWLKRYLPSEKVAT